MRFYASESITINGTPIGFTRAKLDNAGGSRAKRAIIQVKSLPIYFTFDGVTPTSLNGNNAAAGDVIVIDEFDNLVQFKMVSQTGATGTVYVCYET